jgi:hypothetical protein
LCVSRKRETEQYIQNSAGGTAHPERDTQKRIGRTGQAKEDIQNGTAEQDMKYRIGRTGQADQDIRGTGRRGHPYRDRQNRTRRTRQADNIGRTGQT